MVFQIVFIIYILLNFSKQCVKFKGIKKIRPPNLQKIKYNIYKGSIGLFMVVVHLRIFPLHLSVDTKITRLGQHGQLISPPLPP